MNINTNLIFKNYKYLDKLKKRNDKDMNVISYLLFYLLNLYISFLPVINIIWFILLLKEVNKSREELEDEYDLFVLKKLKRQEKLIPSKKIKKKYITK